MFQVEYHDEHTDFPPLHCRLKNNIYGVFNINCAKSWKKESDKISNHFNCMHTSNYIKLISGEWGLLLLSPSLDSSPSITLKSITINFVNLPSVYHLYCLPVNTLLSPLKHFTINFSIPETHIEEQSSSHTMSQSGPHAKTKPSFCSLNQLGVYLPPPPSPWSPLQGYPKQYVAGNHFCIHLGRAAKNKIEFQLALWTSSSQILLALGESYLPGPLPNLGK